MMDKEKALEILLGAVQPFSRVEEVALDQAAGRVLAEDVRADMDAPPFNRSAMDGYAFRHEDLPTSGGVISVRGTVAAGEVFTRTLAPGEGVRIMTGAPVPDGLDTVQMVECSEERDGGKVFLEGGLPRGRNIAPRGQDMQEGEVVLTAGRLIRPVEVAMLATLGKARLKVLARPQVLVHATGDELLLPHEGRPGPGQIRESNGTMLKAQVEALGVGLDARFCGIIPDTEEATAAAIEGAMDADVLILSGGVSMGDFDHVHHELKKRGLKVLIQKVAIKPGKPLLFGSLERPGLAPLWVFGLPGNPVSSFCTFELFVRPFLRALLGLPAPHTLTMTARLEAPMKGKAIRRTQHLPARLRVVDGELVAEQTDWHGSGDLRGLLDTNGFILVPAGGPWPEAPGPVDVVVLEPEALRLASPRSRSAS